MNNHFDLDSAIRKVPDFPKTGILFYDITGVLVNPEAMRYCTDMMIKLYDGKNIDAIAAIEARGFIFGSILAERLGIPLILMRKKGKLPGKTITKTFKLEYGEDSIQMHTEDVKKGMNILIVDDLVATGGTLKAAAEMIEECGAKVDSIFSVIGLPFLPYQEVLKNYQVNTLIEYFGE